MYSLWPIFLVPPATYIRYYFPFSRKFSFLMYLYIRYQLYQRFVKPCQKMIILSLFTFMVLGRREREKKQRWHKKKRFFLCQINTRFTATRGNNSLRKNVSTILVFDFTFLSGHQNKRSKLQTRYGNLAICDKSLFQIFLPEDDSYWNNMTSLMIRATSNPLDKWLCHQLWVAHYTLAK